MIPSEINSCDELLAAWDSGEPVFTVEMGGMGPGYEQAIHIAAFEILRYMLANPLDFEKAREDEVYWANYRDALDNAIFADGAPCKGLGLSGAQHGAACNLAAMYSRLGYQEALAEVSQGRRIQVSKNFPALASTGETP